MVGWLHGWGSLDAPPSTIFCYPAVLEELLECLQNTFGGNLHPSATLVVGGGDHKLSGLDLSLLEEMKSAFPGGIFWEAMDIELPGVEVMPKGLTEHYLRVDQRAILSLTKSNTKIRKMRVLAAWGAWWPRLDTEIPERASAVRFAEETPFVDRVEMPTKTYFRTLSQYEFMLCPAGNGVQSPKIYEALMMGCIPICQGNPAYLGLRNKGWPIVVVDDWGDITAQKLGEWQAELRPLIPPFQNEMSNSFRWWEKEH